MDQSTGHAILVGGEDKRATQSLKALSKGLTDTININLG